MGGLSPGVLPQALPCLRMGCCAPPVLLEQGDEGCALLPELTADGALTLPPLLPSALPLSLQSLSNTHRTPAESTAWPQGL